MTFEESMGQALQMKQAKDILKAETGQIDKFSGTKYNKDYIEKLWNIEKMVKEGKFYDDKRIEK